MFNSGNSMQQSIFHHFLQFVLNKTVLLLSFCAVDYVIFVIWSYTYTPVLRRYLIFSGIFLTSQRKIMNETFPFNVFPQYKKVAFIAAGIIQQYLKINLWCNQNTNLAVWFKEYLIAKKLLFIISWLSIYLLAIYFKIWLLLAL